MTFGASVFLIALGAVLKYALNVESGAINIDMVGTILMIAGAVGLVLGVFLWLSASRRQRAVVTHTTHEEL